MFFVSYYVVPVYHNGRQPVHALTAYACINCLYMPVLIPSTENLCMIRNTQCVECTHKPYRVYGVRQQYKNYIFIYASVHICPQFLLRHHLPSPCNINHLSTTIPNPTYLGLIPDPSTRVHCLCSTLITFIMSIRQSLLHMPTAGE